MMSVPWKVNGVIFRLQGPLYFSIPLRSCLFLGNPSNQVCHEEQVYAPKVF